MLNLDRTSCMPFSSDEEISKFFVPSEIVVVYAQNLHSDMGDFT